MEYTGYVRHLEFGVFVTIWTQVTGGIQLADESSGLHYMKSEEFLR